MPSDPILRASNEAGDTYDDPSEDLLFELRSNVMRCVFREVRDEDLPPLFEDWTDPIAGRMAAFTTPDQADWDAFERRWSRLRADEECDHQSHRRRRRSHRNDWVLG